MMENQTAPNSKRKIVSLLILVAIIVTIPLTVFLLSRDTPTENRANADVQNAGLLTTDLVKDRKKSGADAAIKAQRRKGLMKKLATENPEGFLLNAMDTDGKNSLSGASKEIVESEVEKTGSVELSDMESTEDKYIFVELGPNDELINTYPLGLTEDLEKKIAAGDKINAKGYIIDGTFVPYKITRISGVLAEITTTLPIEHKIAVIPVNFIDKNNQDYTKAELENRFFNDSNSVAKYYESISFGKVKVTGKVFDPVRINWNASTLCNRSDFLFYALRYPTEDADDKVEARGESLTTYKHRAYIFPRLGPTPINTTVEPCTFIAQATIGNQTSPTRGFSRMMVNGHYFQNNLTSRTTVLIHEMGHNLGLGHADTISCGNKPIDFYGSCRDDEYGDHSDIMGFQYHYFPQTGARNKFKLGMIPDENQRVMGNIGTFQVGLHTSSKASANDQVIRIPRKNTGDAYYVEYRRPVGFDRNLPAANTNGAMIKLGPTSKFSVRNNIFKTFLIDTNPGGNSGDRLDRGWFDDAALRDGEVFFDRINNIRVKQVSHDADKVNLEIEIGDPECIRTAPTIQIAPLSKSGAPGTTKSYEVTIENNDSIPCLETAYTLNAIVPAGWTDSVSSRVTVNPGRVSTSNLLVTSPSGAPEGVNDLRFRVTARNGEVQVVKDFKYTVIGESSITPTTIPINTSGPSRAPTPAPTVIPTVPVAKPPIGYYDGASCTISTGWTCDPSNFTTALNVQFYADGPIGTGRLVGTILANDTREAAVGNLCGGRTAHGFKFNTPINLKDGKPHTIHAYAVNIGIAEPNKLLIGSPKTITCTNDDGSAQPSVVPTSTNRPTSTPTPSPLPTDTILKFGSVKLHGIGRGGDSTNAGINGNLNPLTTTREFTVEIYDTNESLVSSAKGNIIYSQTTGDFNGDIKIDSSLPSGQYLVKVKTNKYLRKKVEGILTLNKESVNIMPSVTLTAGDANGDGVLSVLDYNIVLDCYADLQAAENCADQTKKNQADLSDDGKVNLIDFNLFLREISVRPSE